MKVGRLKVGTLKVEGWGVEHGVQQERRVYPAAYPAKTHAASTLPPQMMATGAA